MVFAGTIVAPELAGDTLKASPEQIVGVLFWMTGFGLTVMMKVSVVPTQLTPFAV